MMRMVALGLVIPLGVGVLSAMELSTPPRNAAPTTAPSRVEQIAIVRSAADAAPAAPELQGTLTKSDRLEMAALSRETPVEASRIDDPVTAAVSERIAAPAAAVAPPEPARPVITQRPEAVSKAAAIARPKAPSKPADIKAAKAKAPPQAKTAQAKPAQAKSAEPKHTTIAQRPSTSESGPCRLKAFGGLLRALGSSDCDM